MSSRPQQLVRRSGGASSLKAAASADGRDADEYDTPRRESARRDRDKKRLRLRPRLLDCAAHIKALDSALPRGPYTYDLYHDLYH
eukprot:356939-Chlamydomonas_euryale.AAC.3